MAKRKFFTVAKRARERSDACVDVIAGTVTTLDGGRRAQPDIGSAPMNMTSVHELLNRTVSSRDLLQSATSDADALQWMAYAVTMRVRTAIEHVLAELPPQPLVEVVELVDGALANRIRRSLAARAVLVSLIAGAYDP